MYTALILFCFSISSVAILTNIPVDLIENCIDKLYSLITSC